MDIARQVVASALKIGGPMAVEPVRLGIGIAAVRQPFLTQDTRRHVPLRIGNAPP